MISLLELGANLNSMSCCETGGSSAYASIMPRLLPMLCPATSPWLKRFTRSLCFIQYTTLSALRPHDSVSRNSLNTVGQLRPSACPSQSSYNIQSFSMGDFCLHNQDTTFGSMEITPINLVLLSLAQAGIAFYLFPHVFPTSTLTFLIFVFLLVNFFVLGIYKVIVFPFFLSPLRHIPTASGFLPILGHR